MLTDLNAVSKAHRTEPRKFGCKDLSVSSTMPTKSSSLHSWVWSRSTQILAVAL